MACKIFHLDISWHMLSGSTCLSYSNKSKAKTWKVITSKTYMLDSSVRSCFLSNQLLTVWALCASEISLQDVATVWWEKQIGCLLMRNVVEENKLCKVSPKLVQPFMTFSWITSWILAEVMTQRWQNLSVTYLSTTVSQLFYTPHPNEGRHHVLANSVSL